MSSPGETFVIELGRAAARGRWLVRGLRREDRDDVLAAAVLWCWENRDEYGAQLGAEEPIPLDVWFARSVSKAKRAWRNGDVKNAAAYMADIPVPNETEARAAVESAARELVKSITPEQRRIAIMQANGYQAREISEKLNVDIEKVRSTRSVLRKLHDLIPTAYEVVRVLRTGASPPSDKPAVRTKTSIDVEIEQLGKPKLGGAADFADDYVPHKRQYAAWEDIRGAHAHIYLGRDRDYNAVVLDYEEDGNARRLLLDFGDGGPPVWVMAQFTEVTA